MFGFNFNLMLLMFGGVINTMLTLGSFPLLRLIGGGRFFFLNPPGGEIQPTGVSS